MSIVCIYGDILHKMPMGLAINRGLTFRMAQTPEPRDLPVLYQRMLKGEIDPSFVMSHRCAFERGPGLSKTFRDRQVGCIKVVLRP